MRLDRLTRPRSLLTPIQRPQPIPNPTQHQELWSPLARGEEQGYTTATHHHQQPSLMAARASLINATPWWGGGAFPIKGQREKEGERGKDPGRWQAMAWAVLMRRASLHACARHHEAAAGVRVRKWVGGLVVLGSNRNPELTDASGLFALRSAHLYVCMYVMENMCTGPPPGVLALPLRRILCGAARLPAGTIDRTHTSTGV